MSRTATGEHLASEEARAAARARFRAKRLKEQGKPPEKTPVYNAFRMLEKSILNDNKRRIYNRYLRNNHEYIKEMNIRKANIVSEHGKEPTICYHYYLCDAVNYVGRKQVIDSFRSIQGKGDEIILADYGSTDRTKEIAHSFGFKVLKVPKTEGDLFHESKIVNNVFHETKCNFVVDLNIHTIYPDNIDEFFKNWIKENDIRNKMLVGRGFLVNKNGVKKRTYSASALAYVPFVRACRGYDERTTYGNGTTHYAISLYLDVLGLDWINKPLNMIHMQHLDHRNNNLKTTFSIKNLNEAHRKSLLNGESLIDPLLEDFDEGVKQVHNSYW